MKEIICFLVCSYITITIVNGQNHFIKNSNVRDYDWCRYVEMPFMVDELIDVYIKDTTIVSKHFPSQEKRIGQQDCYVGHWCLYDTGAKILKDSLLNRRNSSNEHIIEKILSEIGCLPPQKPDVDWGLVFTGCEDCEKCPFSDYAPGARLYEKASLIYMSEPEIEQMIAYKDGEQWGYMLDGIRLGDVFEGVTSTNPIRREIDRRVMQFLIDKWSPCQIPEVQELVKVLEESMPLEELANPVDVITGTWRGAFGNKTINFTIDYDASIAEAEKEYAKQTRWGMFTDCYFGVLGTSLFEGQPASKAVTSKGYYDDGGKAVRVNLIEQPDTAQWNGEFNIWIDRKTNMMHGTWESNNKKLKREFELEKVKE